MYYRIILLILSFCVPVAYADDPPPPVAAAKEETLQLEIAPQVSTIFPIFAGGGADFVIDKHFQLGFSYGITPKGYYSEIGQVAADLGGNAAYKNVIEAAFQNNSLWRADLQYNFRTARSGWHVGFAFSHLTSSGNAGIDSVLQAASGLDYSQLTTLLTQAGKSTEVAMQSSLWLGEIHGGYSWELGNSFVLTTQIGVTKVLGNSVQLDTGLPTFEATKAGSTLISSSESSLQSIINQYGVSPTLGVTFSYFFSLGGTK
jgi:hypothetical protein